MSSVVSSGGGGTGLVILGEASCAGGATIVSSGLSAAAVGRTVELEVELEVVEDVDDDNIAEVVTDEAVVGWAAAGFVLGIAVHLLPSKLVINAPAGRLAFVAILKKVIKGESSRKSFKDGISMSPQATYNTKGKLIEEKEKLRGRSAICNSLRYHQAK